MITDLKPYPVMKDSGVEWLGEVPEHWEVRRLKYLLREMDLRSTDGSEQLLRVSQYTGVTERKSADGSEEPDTRASSLVGYKRVCPDELVINIMLAWNGSMGVSAFDGIASPAYCVYRFNEQAAPWYFHNLLRSPAYKARIKTVSTGIVESRLRLYTDDLSRLEALLPPLPEQASIVRYLDHVDRRMRRFVRAKQKLIGLLEEQKQAIIHRAVTRGLDPDVPLKDSGVEWLGEVPEHWEVRRLKQVSRTQGGFAFSADSFGNEGVPVVRMNNIRRGVLDFDKVVRVPEHQCKDAFALNEGDIVYGLSGSIGATGSLGNYAVVRSGDLPAQLNQRVARFQPATDRITEGFLVESLQTSAFYEQVLSHTTGTAQFNVSTNDIGNVALALPPVDEQERIVRHLSTAAAGIDTDIDRARREIELLREYRTRLIADVVTGKLDVREAAANLPDEPDEPEPLDEVDDLMNSDEELADDLDAIPEEVEA